MTSNPVPTACRFGMGHPDRRADLARALSLHPRRLRGLQSASLRDDGWAIASHIALSTLMSLFPFLIFVTALTGFLGTEELADQVGEPPARGVAEGGRGADRDRDRAAC